VTPDKPVAATRGQTAWERWELASLDEAKQAQPPKPAEAPPEPPVQLPTADDLERIQTQAHDEGYQAGYREGQNAARAEAERLGRAASQLETTLAELEQTTADELVALAMELARQVVRHEIAAKPERILDVVRDALAQLPHQHAAIYLHPNDAAIVRSYLGEALNHAGHRIHEDAKLQLGDCILESSGSRVDGTVATRWRRVLESLGIESVWREGDEP
jgi:flagellar assembly protein FliH